MTRLLALLLACLCAAALAQTDARKSGYEFMSKATQAMQRDDTQNPAMLWVQNGAALWAQAAGGSGKSCAGCHGEAERSMRGVAARYPAFHRGSGRVLNLQQRIEACRTGAQQAPAFGLESENLLALESFVALQSRGMPLAPPRDTATRVAATRGKALFLERIGQLGLSCAQCHDDNWGRRLASAVIPQGHANAYPIYRLEWQAMGSLQRRLRNCMSGVRAEVPPYGAPALTELETYLAARAAGMALESPGVRP
jgi:sulfur-oxidizing protein SoxA